MSIQKKKRIIHPAIKFGSKSILGYHFEYEYFILKNSNALVLIIPGDPNCNGHMYNKIITNIFYNFFNKKNISAMRTSLYKTPIKEAHTIHIGQITSCLDILLDLYDQEYMYIANNAPVKVFVLGFSFGALIAHNIAMRREEVQAFIALSPPIEYYNFFTQIYNCNINGLIIAGEQDPLCPKDKVLKYIKELGEKKNQIKHHFIAQADHQFSNTKIFNSTLSIINNYINGDE